MVIDRRVHIGAAVLLWFVASLLFYNGIDDVTTTINGNSSTSNRDSRSAIQQFASFSIAVLVATAMAIALMILSTMILATPTYIHATATPSEYIGENSLLVISYRNVVKVCVFAIILATIIHIVLGDTSTMNNTYYAIGYSMSVGMCALLYFVLLRGEHADRINDYHNAKNPVVVEARAKINGDLSKKEMKAATVVAVEEEKSASDEA